MSDPLTLLERVLIAEAIAAGRVRRFGPFATSGLDERPSRERFAHHRGKVDRKPPTPPGAPHAHKP